MSLFRDVCLLCRTRLPVELLATGFVCKCPLGWEIALEMVHPRRESSHLLGCEPAMYRVQGTFGMLTDAPISEPTLMTWRHFERPRIRHVLTLFESPCRSVLLLLPPQHDH